MTRRPPRTTLTDTLFPHTTPCLSAEMPDGQPRTSTEISTRHAIPHKFLEQILVDLRNAGLRESRRGKHGGYVMLRPADTITFGEVQRLLDRKSTRLNSSH